MKGWVIVLLALNGALVVAMLVILFAVLKQGKRITGMAHEAERLASNAAARARDVVERGTPEEDDADDGREEPPPPPA